MTSCEILSNTSLLTKKHKQKRFYSQLGRKELKPKKKKINLFAVIKNVLIARVICHETPTILVIPTSKKKTKQVL